MKKTLGIIILVLCIQFTQAQSVGENRGPLQRFAHWRETKMMKGIDTTYIRLPEKGWIVGANVLVSNINLTEYFWEANSTDYLLFNMNSGFSWKPHISLAYRGLELGYGYDFAHRYNIDLSLQLNGKRFGGELNYLTFTGASTFCMSNLTHYLPIEESFISAKRIAINAYYVFNTETFSYPASIKQTFFQKKSSGSVIAGAGFFYNDLKTDSISVENLAIQQILSGEQHVVCSQVAIGAGYAYNFVFRDFPLLLHASIMPMLSHTFDAHFYQNDNDNKVNQLDPSKHRIGPTIVARGAISYALKEDILIGANINYKYYRSNLSEGIALSTINLTGQAYVAFRF